MLGLISLVSNKHVGKNLKKISVYAYFGSILKKMPKIDRNMFSPNDCCNYHYNLGRVNYQRRSDTQSFMKIR